MKQAEEERKRHGQLMDTCGKASLDLEHDIDNKIMGQLMENTNTVLEKSKRMERVVNKLKP